MAIGDLKAEEQVWHALVVAYEALTEPTLTEKQREHAVRELHEALKRVQEAKGE